MGAASKVVFLDGFDELFILDLRSSDSAGVDIV